MGSLHSNRIGKRMLLANDERCFKSLSHGAVPHTQSQNFPFWAGLPERAPLFSDSPKCDADASVDADKRFCGNPLCTGSAMAERGRGDDDDVIGSVSGMVWGGCEKKGVRKWHTIMCQDLIAGRANRPQNSTLPAKCCASVRFRYNKELLHSILPPKPNMSSL